MDYDNKSMKALMSMKGAGLYKPAISEMKGTWNHNWHDVWYFPADAGISWHDVCGLGLSKRLLFFKYIITIVGG